MGVCCTVECALRLPENALSGEGTHEGQRVFQIAHVHTLLCLEPLAGVSVGASVAVADPLVGGGFIDRHCSRTGVKENEKGVSEA